MFRIGLAVDPYCEACLGAEICDIQHFFCSCSRVSEVWLEVRALMVGILGVVCDSCSDWELVILLFPSSSSMADKQAVWIIGTFVGMIWEELFIRSRPALKKEQFFGSSSGDWLGCYTRACYVIRCIG